MICPTYPFPLEPPEKLTLSVGAYWTPARNTEPPPDNLSVLFFGGLQFECGSKGWTLQIGLVDFRTIRVRGMVRVVDVGDHRCTVGVQGRRGGLT